MGIFFSKRDSTTKKHKLTYGKATFLLQPQDLQTIQSIDKQNYNILFQQDWNIQYKQFIKYKWGQVFNHMIESNAQVVALYQSGSQNIVKEITNIRFNSLINLSLGNNNISNVQNITFLKMPNLKILRLNENQIVSIKSLCKLNNNQLEYLNLYDNQVVNLKTLTRIRFNHKKNNVKNNKLSLSSKNTQIFDNQVVNIIKIQLQCFSLMLDTNILRQPYIKFIETKRKMPLNQ